MRELGQFLYGGYERTVHHQFRRLTRGQRVSLRQLGLLPRVLTRYERRTALALSILCLSTALVLLGRWYNRHTVVVPAPGGEYSEGVVGTPRTGNPLLAGNDAEHDLAYLTYRGLFRYDANTTVVPDLASSWRVSTDQKTYYITLRPDLHWSDGSPLTVDDVVFTFQALHDTKLGSPLATSFAGVSVKREDDQTISFTLPEPYSPFLSALTLGIIPVHTWQARPPTDWRDTDTSLAPIGTGPYRVKSINHDHQGTLHSLTLEPNPFSHTEQPYITKFVLKFYPDTTSALAALHDGSIDGLGGLRLPAAVGLDALKFSYYELRLPQYTALFYNLEQPGVLSPKLVREALSLMTNRQQLSHDIVGGDAVPATGPFPFGEVKARTAGRQNVSYNLEQAKELLKKAGFSRVDDHGTWKNKDQALALTLTASADSAEQVAVATNLKQQWEAAGAEITLELLPREQLQTQVLPQRNYQAILAREVVGFEPDPYPFWHSSQATAGGLNLANFKNHDADKVLEDARHTSDSETRLQDYARFQDIVSDESPATFLYSLSYTYVASRAAKLPAPAPIANAADRFRNLANWYTATKRVFRW